MLDIHANVGVAAAASVLLDFRYDCMESNKDMCAIIPTYAASLIQDQVQLYSGFTDWLQRMYSFVLFQFYF